MADAAADGGWDNPAPGSPGGRGVRVEPVLSPPTGEIGLSDPHSAALSPAFLLRHAAKSGRLERALTGGRTRGRSRLRAGADPPRATAALAVEAVSHLKLSQLGLSSLRGVHVCRELTALYAYENELEELDDFSGGMRKLETLHLERNQLSSAAVAGGLTGLYALRKLHLDGNRIAVLAGLESCPGLQHLTLADQRSAEPLTFSRPALTAVGGCLQTLDVSGCRIASLRPLQLLRAIETLNCDRNDISDMVEVAELLRSARWMSDFSLRDNPVSALRNYRHKAIAVSQPSLRRLDGAEVTAKQRDFLLRLELRKRGLGRANAAPDDDGSGGAAEAGALDAGDQRAEAPGGLEGHGVQPSRR
ncbi:hypothetical protein FNF27_01452 [Cafeteria roenbergensis]|uniref:U2A'/phosphoprotein 32 family A C-terminal domain-containing protein n=1 Tax=Cafeteria roenbergensis TaxID=33653 RepID=A0A5A8EHT9_CAFRO|nr:hypothetical protein FNF27_01452 [Cafeteria roenbergensis]